MDDKDKQVMSDHDLLLRLDTKVETLLDSHEKRISRMEAGLVGTIVGLVVTIGAMVIGLIITRKD